MDVSGEPPSGPGAIPPAAARLPGQEPFDADAGYDWHRAYKMIELENQLVNHRLTALLALQGFLFAALALAVPSLAGQNREQQLVAKVALILLAVVGLLSPLIVHNGIIAALWQIRASAVWLRRRSNPATREGLREYPPIVGRHDCAEYGRPLAEGGEGMTPQDVAEIGDYAALKVGVHLLPRLLLVPIWIAILLAGLYLLVAN